MDSQSHISPYLHFGMICTQGIAIHLEPFKAQYGQDVGYWLRAAVLWREFACNFVHHNEDGYDRLDELYPAHNNRHWAQRDLKAHAKDRRRWSYTQRQFEEGRTHDALWNAAQLQMVLTGNIRTFRTRSYWAKKILEWSHTPDQAFKTAIYLNDKYSLDGRDPNGYYGIAWALGALHDAQFPERPVFGRIRYVSETGHKKRYDVDEYIAGVRDLCSKLKPKLAGSLRRGVKGKKTSRRTDRYLKSRDGGRNTMAGRLMSQSMKQGGYKQW